MNVKSLVDSGSPEDSISESPSESPVNSDEKEKKNIEELYELFYSNKAQADRDVKKANQEKNENERPRTAAALREYVKKKLKKVRKAHVLKQIAPLVGTAGSALLVARMLRHKRKGIQ